MDTDIVCGRPVATNTPFATRYGDRDFRFCSKKCEYDFATNPLRYVDKSRSVGSNEGRHSVRPDGQELKSEPRDDRAG